MCPSGPTYLPVDLFGCRIIKISTYGHEILKYVQNHNRCFRHHEQQ
jgi:hypothetical protein